MDLLGGIPSEVGLKLLLCPIGSNVVVRTACCSIGIALPVYSTFKAIERKDADEQKKCLLYWAAYGSFSIAEIFTDKIIYWVPLYYHVKFAFLVWLQLPSTDGAGQIYLKFLQPFFLKHQARLDQVLGIFYGEATKFVSAHQGEIQFAKKIAINILAAANQMARDLLHPTATARQPNQIEAIESPTEDAAESDSGNEE